MALAVVVALLAAANIARSAIVPDRHHLWFNLSIGAVVAGIGVAAGLTRGELGLRRDRVTSGLAWGGATLFLITVVVRVAALIPAFESAFEDTRADLDLGDLLVRVAVVIPLGTVLVEEAVFRGVVLALLLRMLRPHLAVLSASILFGLWHVYPASRGGSENAMADDVDRSLAVLGTFVATTIAGFVFCWLHRRADSLVAPILAHIGTNSIPLTVAWIVTTT